RGACPLFHDGPPVAPPGTAGAGRICRDHLVSVSADSGAAAKGCGYPLPDAGDCLVHRHRCPGVDGTVSAIEVACDWRGVGRIRKQPAELRAGYQTSQAVDAGGFHWRTEQSSTGPIPSNVGVDSPERQRAAVDMGSAAVYDISADVPRSVADL